MKTTNRILKTICILLVFSVSLSWAQDEGSDGPQYVTITTFHWNMDYEDFDMDTWKAVEKEYYDKVTSQNELIKGSGVYMHRFTPDNRELLFVNAYSSWEDIDKVNERNQELAEAGWPDKEERSAFFKKRNAYYSDFHSDEIYSLMPHVKPAPLGSSDILLLRKSRFLFPDDGSGKEFMEAFEEYVTNVFHKNELIQGYYPAAHFWGSDRREFIEGFMLKSMADLDAMFDKNNELFAAHFNTDEMKEKASEMGRKYFDGYHGDYIYTVIKELRK